MRNLLLILMLLTGFVSKAQNNTWSDNVASIIYNKCSSCHHQGAIGPFNLMSYSDAVAAASGIFDAVSNDRMPPWPPDTTYRKFAHQRTLSIQQKDAILDWINNGLPIGNATAPAPPVFPAGSTINQTPDLVSQMPVFTNYSASSDIYQCFVIPSGLSTAKYIKGYEVIPGNRQVVHHVLIYADTTGTCANLDAQDPNVGYLSFGGVGTNSAQLIGLWAPGADPMFYPNGMGLRLPANADIVLQVHYPAGTMGQQDSTKVNFFFSNAPTIRALSIDPILNHVTSLTNGPLFIPANQTKTFYGQFTVPTILGKVSVLQVAPHMHLIGRTIKSYAVDQGNNNIPLIRINNWDFRWQGAYDFQQVQVIPTGSTLYFEADYDNTPNNPFNPFNPPINIVAGEATTDEMMIVYFTYTKYQPGDENIIMDSTLITTYKPIDSENNFLQVYPNPVVQKTFTINAPVEEGQHCSLELTDITGRVVYEEKKFYWHNNKVVQLPFIDNGILFLNLKTPTMNYFSKLTYIN